MDWSTILTIAAGITVIVVALEKIFGAVTKTLNSIKALFSHSASNDGNVIPKQTISIIPEPRINALWWSMGAHDNKPMMQIVGDFHVTNRLGHDIKLAGSLIKVRKWFFLSRIERGDVMVKDMQSPYSGDYPIPSHQMASVRISFFPIPRPFAKKSKAFSARIAIIDQYANEHWLKVRFKSNENILQD